MRKPNINTFAPNHTVTLPGRDIDPFDKKDPVVVVGAGAFGGWTALHLLKKSYKVTLIDAWGPGNSRSSSGDETRVTRSTYGGNELYFQMNVRALELWKEYQEIFQNKIFFNTGVLWMCYQADNPIVDDSIPFSKKYKCEYQILSRVDLASRYPEINGDDLSHGVLDPHGGYLKARESCQAVVEHFIAQGGDFIQAEAKPVYSKEGRMREVSLSNGNTIKAGSFLFACGSWLPFMFPEVLGKHVSCTKQEVYYFGVPSAKAETFDQFPVWIDLDGANFYYGTPGYASRGFKVGLDRRGVTFDPTNGERKLDDHVLEHARQFIARRFPSLKDAPLLENRVCPYENSLTGNFIFERHPDFNNLYFLGGGSGHGFKHGPALGELVAQCLSAERKVPQLFQIFTPVS
jgi:glycine/D-amino acid oxidase-like deaminating enzyme